MTDLPVRRYLDLTTAHITMRDAELLALHDTCVIEFAYNYGWFIPIMPNNEDEGGYDDAMLREEGYSEAFITLLQFCRDHAVELLRLDQDGHDEIEGLPTFDW